MDFNFMERPGLGLQCQLLYTDLIKKQKGITKIHVVHRKKTVLKKQNIIVYFQWRIHKCFYKYTYLYSNLYRRSEKLPKINVFVL